MKHIRKISVLGALCTILILSACGKGRHWVKGSGSNVTQTRTVTGYNGIYLNIDAKIEYVTASDYSLEINAQQNIADVIETVTEGSRLTVRYKHDVNVRSHNPVTIRISSPALSFLGINGSGNISCNNTINTSAMSCSVNGSGDISISSLAADNLDMSISGSGNVTIHSGRVNSENVRISGSGDISMTELVSQSAQVSISGSGDVRLQATESLNVSISGSGDVYYKGSPTVNANISGSGSVIKL